MDISKLSHGAKVVLATTVAFLIVSFFNWQEVEFEGLGSAGVSMWHGVGVIAGLLAIALLLWEGLKLIDFKLELGITPTMVAALLAALLLIFTVIKFLVANEFRTFWSWIGLLLAIAIAVGAWMNMQAAGENLADVRDRVAGATGAAKSTPTTPAAEQPLDTSPSPSEPVRDVSGSGTSDTVVAPEGDDEPRPTA